MQTNISLLRLVRILFYISTVLIHFTQGKQILFNFFNLNIVTDFFFNFFKGGKHQKRLLENLFKDYDPEERPVANDTDTLVVLVGLAIQQIVDVDEKKQTLVFSGWLDMVKYFVIKLKLFAIFVN